MNSPSIKSIHIYASHLAFAYPPSSSGKLVITKVGNSFECCDALTGNASAVVATVVNDVLVELAKEQPVLDTTAFNAPPKLVEDHFGSVWTDDYPCILFVFQFSDSQAIECFSAAQHACLLPFSIQTGNQYRETFNPKLSEALANLLPEGFLLRARLASGDTAFEFEALTQQERAETESVAEDATENAHETASEDAIDEILESLLSLTSDAESEDARRVAEETGDISSRLLRRTSVQSVKDLLAQGANPSVVDEDGRSALMRCCYPPFDAERFWLLVQAGANVDATCPEGTTGLLSSCASGEDEAVQAWIEAGANVHARGRKGVTPLMWGSRWGPIVKCLLKAGANVNDTDDEGHSPLMYLISQQRGVSGATQLEALDHLLAAGADPELADSSGETSLDHAKFVLRRCKLEDEVCDRINESSKRHYPPQPSDFDIEIPPDDGEIAPEFAGWMDDAELAQLIADRLLDAVGANEE